MERRGGKEFLVATEADDDTDEAANVGINEDNESYSEEESLKDEGDDDNEVGQETHLHISDELLKDRIEAELEDLGSDGELEENYPNHVSLLSASTCGR